MDLSQFITANEPGEIATTETDPMSQLIPRLQIESDYIMSKQENLSQNHQASIVGRETEIEQQASRQTLVIEQASQPLLAHEEVVSTII